jgi:hypothetical protein
MRPEIQNSACPPDLSAQARQHEMASPTRWRDTIPQPRALPIFHERPHNYLMRLTVRSTAAFGLAISIVSLLGTQTAGALKSSKSTADEAGRSIGAVPGRLPSRLCTSSIYSGSNDSAVVTTRDDIVVGPARFGTLREATRKGNDTFRSSSRLFSHFKGPITISGTSSRWIAVRVSGDKGQVMINYDPFGVGSRKHTTPNADVAALQTAVGCGHAETGFVQYNGGFTWQHSTCAMIQVFDDEGHLLGSKTIPFGKRAC